MHLLLADRLSQIRSSIMARTRLTNGFGDERVVIEWSGVVTTRPPKANPVTNSFQTLVARFAWCVPVKPANERFNHWASCKVNTSVAYAYEAAECARGVPRAKTCMRGDIQGMLLNFWRSCIEVLGAYGCLDPGRKSSRLKIWGKF